MCLDNKLYKNKSKAKVQTEKGETYLFEFPNSTEVDGFLSATMAMISEITTKRPSASPSVEIKAESSAPAKIAPKIAQDSPKLMEKPNGYLLNRLHRL